MSSNNPPERKQNTISSNEMPRFSMISRFFSGFQLIGFMLGVVALTLAGKRGRMTAVIAHRPSCRTSLPSLVAVPDAVLSSLPPARRRAGEPGPFLTRRPRPLPSSGADEPSQVPGNPCVHALLFTPGGSPASSDTMQLMLRSAIRKTSAPHLNLSRLNHPACKPPVYAPKLGSGLARNSGHRGTWRRAPRGMRDTAERMSRAPVVLGGRSYERGPAQARHENGAPSNWNR